MKKILFTLLLLLLPTLILADDNTTTVEMTGQTTSGHNRSGLSVPSVTYSSILNALIVEYASDDTYYLDVEDTNGTTWYSGPIDTSGMPTIYYVNLSVNNTYIITITSANNTFVGYLEL